MYCTDFEYDNEKLSDYGMMICSFHGTGGFETVSSGADITFHQQKSAGSNNFHLYASAYDAPYTTTFQIFKNPCLRKTPAEQFLSADEISALQRWLCRKDRYHKFKPDQDGYRNLFWKAAFTSKQVMLQGQAVGLELTMFTDAPYAYLDMSPLAFDCKANVPFTIYDMSDEEGYIYPSVEITCLKHNEDGETYTLELSNSRDHNTMRIAGCREGETITIDGEHLIISSSCPTASSEAHASLSSDFNYSFPKIINTYGNTRNDFTPNIDCRIVLRYFPVKKLGL